MGTVRIFALICLGCVLGWLPASSQAQVQQPNVGQTKSVLRAYYQPLNRSQYRQHLQQVGNNETDEIPRRQEEHVRPPAWLNGQLAPQNQGQQFQPEASPGKPLDSSNFDFAAPIPASPISVRQYQNDPFGEQQSRQFSAENQFVPPTATSQQDDPFGEKQEPRPVKPVKPIDEPFDPFGEKQKPRPTKPVKPVDKPFQPQQPVEPPATPKRIPDSIIPFADPPPRDQDLKEPVLPPDAQFSPKPGKTPELTAPKNGNQSPAKTEPPTEPTDPPMQPPTEPKPPTEPSDPPTQPSVQDQPPSPTQSDLTDPPAVQPTEKTPQQPVVEEKVQPANPIEDAFPVPENVYTPPSKKLPPIVQPGQVPNNTYVPEPAPKSYLPPPVPQPSYQPLYDPIPAVESRPTQREPQPLYLKSDSTPRYFSPTPRHSIVPRPNSGLPHCRPAASPSEPYCHVVAPKNCPPQSCETKCPNFYFGFMGGWTGLRDIEAASINGRFETSNGTGFSFALGRRNGCNLRTEVNFSFHENEIERYIAGNRSQRFTGELTSFAGMANAYWEFVEVPSCCFKPYLGLGIGFISINSEIRDLSGQSIIAPNINNDSSFAYQWMGGLNYQAYPNLDVYAEYRFMGADDFRIETTGALSDRYSYRTDNVFLGFRWKF